MLLELGIFRFSILNSGGEARCWLLSLFKRRKFVDLFLACRRAGSPDVVLLFEAAHFTGELEGELSIYVGSASLPVAVDGASCFHETPSLHFEVL